MPVSDDGHEHEYAENGCCEHCGKPEGAPDRTSEGHVHAKIPGAFFPDVVEAMRESGADVTIIEVTGTRLDDDRLAICGTDEAGTVLHASVLDGRRAKQAEDALHALNGPDDEEA